MSGRLTVLVLFAAIGLIIIVSVAGAGARALQVEDGPNGAASAIVIRLQPGRELQPNALRRSLPAGAGVTPHQVRLDLGRLSEGWREGLVRALDAIAGATAAPA